MRPPLPAAARAGVLALAIVATFALPSTATAQTPDEHDAAAAPGPVIFVRLFGSVDWGATQLPDRVNSFALGQFAIFVTSAINERVSVLAEVVMEGSGTNTRVITDLERLQLTFRLDDHLQLSAGRYHTGIGYYNAAFHHGSYFETPIGRPRVFAFEDEGGVLPVHEVGLSVHGAVPKMGSALHYLAEVGNGRLWNLSEPDPMSEGQDQNRAKSTNLGLSFRPDRWHGVEIGGSWYRDTIPRGTAPAIAHRIGAAYLVYRTPSTELMAEWLSLSHRVRGTTARYTNGSGYAQASHAWGMVRPYYRYDRLKIDPATPLIGSTQSAIAHIVGVRIDPAEWVGLKAQYEHGDEEGHKGVDAVRTQLVFVF